jgi:hypothetical protein
MDKFRPIFNYNRNKLKYFKFKNEIMDKFRPTIVVSEMIGNRRDCAFNYQVKCSLEERHDTRLLSQFWCEKANEAQREICNEFRDEDGRWVGATIVLRSYQGQGTAIKLHF